MNMTFNFLETTLSTDLNEILLQLSHFGGRTVKFWTSILLLILTLITEERFTFLRIKKRNRRNDAHSLRRFPTLKDEQECEVLFG
ncbi:MAG TPA: hypothetical protein DIW81_26250 [Planctomycetaceae bacterium]|nr:hypothetical protein [Planctomycetaceae bacterium]